MLQPEGRYRRRHIQPKPMILGRLIGVKQLARRLYVTCIQRTCDTLERRDRYPDQVLGLDVSCYAATATGAQLFAIGLAVKVLLLGSRERSLPDSQPTASLPRRDLSSP